MHGKLIGAFVAVMLLAACSTPDTEATSRSATGGAASTGSETPFGVGGDTVYFDLDRSVIRDDARGILDRQAEWLNRNKTLNVLVAGNCDERGTSEYNIALGGRRAYAASSYLVVKGIDVGRLNIISYGKERPIAAGSSEDAWAKNRNAVTSLR